MGASDLSLAARRGAAFIALVAAVTLVVRFYLRLQEATSVLAALSYMAQYFTLLTNALTFALMVWIAFGGNVSGRFIRAIVISIVCVGLIYHTLLAHLVTLSGIELWADHGTHTFVPLLSGLWWLFLAPKPGVRAADLGLWVVWPLLYCAYILVRGSFSGFYPYPFLNVPEIGWQSLGINIVGLSLAFVVVGVILSTLGRLVGRRNA